MTVKNTLKSDKHFEVYLKAGRPLTFDGKCDTVDYSSQHAWIFKQKASRNESYAVLALIPPEEILYVMSVDNVKENENE